MRTWRDKTYTVLIGDNGFIFADRLYPSLSPIAREITGTAWSGRQMARSRRKVPPHAHNAPART
jgi:hypothetical protein